MNNQPLFTPGSDRVTASQMHQLMNDLSHRFSFAPTWKDFHQWSVTHRGEFWSTMMDFAEIRPSSEATAPYAGEGMLGTQWFPGLRMNYAEHLLRFSDDHIAIRGEDECGRSRSISYAELRKQVAGVAAGLRSAGVTKGDRVAGFMPNIPEAIIAMLATTSIGAVWSSCSPDFGLGGVLDRFGQIGPKVLFSADGYSYNGKCIDCRDRITGILDAIPEITSCVVVQFAPEPVDCSGIDKAVAWSDFCDSQAALEFEQVPFDHPLYIMYSSGTTGVPKCIVHGHGGTLLQHMKELMLHCDLRRDDTIFYFTTCGWMMWNWLVSSLGVGATVVVYDGSPFAPDNQHMWRMTERLGISIFGTSPKFLSACQKAGLHPAKQQDLSRLKTMLSTGSPLTIENFNWVYDEVKQDLQLSSIAGGTDIISCFMLGNPMLPVYAGEIQCLGLGMDVQAFDSQAQPVIGQKGELVCCSPFPSQPVGFYHDEDDGKYRSAYFEHFDGIWRHGDFVEITEHGGVVVFGRSDATLNPGGVRIGTAEIYRQVESMDEVVDSVVVGQRTDDGDVDVCLFVVLREGIELDQPLVDTIKQHIRKRTTPRHVPRKIRQVSSVPYTISGKKVEMAVTQMIHGENVANRDALANPEALDQYAGLV